MLQEERRIQHQKDVKLRTVDVELAEYRSELNRKELRLTSEFRVMISASESSTSALEIGDE